MTELMFEGRDGSALGRGGWMIVKGVNVDGLYGGKDLSIKVINTRGCSPRFALEIPLEMVDTFTQVLQTEKENALERKRRRAMPYDPPTVSDESAL
jgi:hypothetical protein